MSARPHRSDPIEPPAEVREVADQLIETLGADLRAILWHGSWARGEANPDSDHDLIVVLRRADDEILMRMQKVFRGRRDWSTFVQTEEELRQYPPDGRPQFHFGLVPLYGDFQPPQFRQQLAHAGQRVHGAFQQAQHRTVIRSIEAPRRLP